MAKICQNLLNQPKNEKKCHIRTELTVNNRVGRNAEVSSDWAEILSACSSGPKTTQKAKFRPKNFFENFEKFKKN